MNAYFIAAALISAFTCLIHAIAGGREIAKPLLAVGELGKIPKYTTYYCWHLVTITLAAIALAFWLAATDETEILLAMFATGAATLFALWSLAMIAIFKLRLWHFPQWALFIPAAALGFAGLVL